MAKLGIGHGRLLIILGGLLGRITPGLNVIPGAERVFSTVFHAVAIWATISLVTAFGYAAGRKLLIDDAPFPERSADKTQGS